MTFSILSPLLILAATGIYGLVHSWLASLPLKQKAGRLFGKAIVDRYYRLAYNVFAGISLLPAMALVGFLPDHTLYTIPFPWVLLSLALQGLAVLALLAGLRQTGLLEFLGLRQIFEPPGGQPPQLVVDGLYRYVRHPLYTAGFVFIWTSPVMTVNLLALFASLTGYLIIGAHYEERRLLREYGETYRRYRQVTPMFIPQFPGKAFKV